MLNWIYENMLEMLIEKFPSVNGLHLVEFRFVCLMFFTTRFFKTKKSRSSLHVLLECDQGWNLCRCLTRNEKKIIVVKGKHEEENEIAKVGFFLLTAKMHFIYWVRF